MQSGKSGNRTRQIVIGSLLLLASVGLPLAAFESYLSWDNRRPQVPHTSVELGGRTYSLMVPSEALADLRDALPIIGDSFTAGVACGLDGNYPSRLGRLLAQHGDPYRVLNLGIPGTDPFGYLQLVESLMARDNVPPLVVLTLYSNDIELSCSVCRAVERIRRDPGFSTDEVARLEIMCARCASAADAASATYSVPRRMHNWLLSRSYVYALVRDALVGFSMRLGYNTGWGRTAYPPLWRDRGSTEFRLMQFALTGARDALATRGSGMFVVIYPDVEGLQPDNQYVGIYRDVEKELSRSLGVPVWSGYRAFLNRADSTRRMSYSLVDHHPSCEAHQIFAEGVYARLREAGWTSGASRTGPAVMRPE